MAQIITTEKKPTSTTYRTYGQKKEETKRPPMFRKTNYILMIAGAVVLLIGYILLSGGGSKDPAQFSTAIFDTRRLVVAPITILIGLVTEIVAIMWHPRVKNTEKEEPVQTENAQ